MHIDDANFALSQGLIPDQMKKEGISGHFYLLGKAAELPKKQIDRIVQALTSKQDKVLALIAASYLDERRKRTYQQHYQTRIKKLLRA